MSLAAARMNTQGLVRPIGSATEVVRHLVGLQAQDEWIAQYAIRPRATDHDQEGLICTWVMRGTLHLVTKEDAWWLVQLLGPRFIAKQRGRRHQLGLTDDVLKQALPIIASLKSATRAEIAAAVRKRGIDLAKGQAEAHLMATAAMSGLIDRHGKRLSHGDTPEDPLRELAKRYVAGYAPAEPEDFAAWSGLTLTEARGAMRDLEQPTGGSETKPRLLGHFDPYLLGYRDRSFTLDPAHAKHIQRGGGFLQPIVVVDGLVKGTWRRTGDTVEVTSFGEEIKGLEEEIQDVLSLQPGGRRQA